ncbi:MAG: peptide ABC transporter substrate-binding protein [Chthoniobacterales bacterium]
MTLFNTFSIKQPSSLFPASSLSPIRFLLLFFVGINFIFSGCWHQSPKADLVLINGVEPESLDPAVVTGQPDGRLVSELFEGLLRFNRQGQVVPGVASSWDISPDQCTYTFHLRPEACWSDGRKVTASDFVGSWRRILLPTTAAPYSDQLFVIRGAEDFGLGKIDFSQVGMKALDDQTLQVTLAHPTPYFLQLCALWAFFPVRSDLIERCGDHWMKPKNMISNGPYTLAEWKINDKIVLKKNPFYWDASHVALETIDVLPISRATVAYNFYAVGQADLMMGRPSSLLLDTLKKGTDFHESPYLGIFFIRFNCSRAPFNDPRIRKAFAMVIDRRRITEKITRAGELPAQSFIPPGIPGYVPSQGLGYDPERAKKLLAEAGYPGGKNFPLTNYLYNEGEINEGIALELQAMWQQELGVSILLERREWKVYLSSMNRLDFGMAISNWVGDYADPNTFLDLFVTGGGNNRTGWSSQAYDYYLKEASAEVNPKQRFALFHDAEDLLVCEETPIIPLFFNLGIQLYRPDQLGGIEPNLLDKHPLSQMYRKSKNQ